MTEPQANMRLRFEAAETDPLRPSWHSRPCRVSNADHIERHRERSRLTQRPNLTGLDLLASRTALSRME